MSTQLNGILVELDDEALQSLADIEREARAETHPIVRNRLFQCLELLRFTYERCQVTRNAYDECRRLSLKSVGVLTSAAEISRGHGDELRDIADQFTSLADYMDLDE